jgi:hypothetical protein
MGRSGDARSPRRPDPKDRLDDCIGPSRPSKPRLSLEDRVKRKTNAAQQIIAALTGHHSPEYVTLAGEYGPNPHHRKKGPGRKHAQGKRKERA